MDVLNNNRFSAYRIMWVFVLFDLPTETKKERDVANSFRKKLQKDGFSMFQYSIYIRHCFSKENADVHRKRVKQELPKTGKVCVFCLTDKQFGDIDLFYGQKKQTEIMAPSQLELF